MNDDDRSREDLEQFADVDNAVRIHAARIVAGETFKSPEDEGRHCVKMAKLIRAVADREVMEAANAKP